MMARVEATEDQRPEGVQRRQLIHPGSWTEVGAGVDKAGENRVRFPKDLAGVGIGYGGSLAG
jgi:hypothetical protein